MGAVTLARATGASEEPPVDHAHQNEDGGQAAVDRRPLYAGPVPQPARSRTRAARLSRKRRRKVNAADNDLTPAQWEAIKLVWGGCAYCGATDRPLQRDTMLPISRGGRYTLENVVPACGSCNASKGNDEITGWLRRTRRDERLFLERYTEKVPALRAQFAADE